MNRDGQNISLWQETTFNNTKAIDSRHTEIYDVLIVGAGITGITTALQLQEAGKTVIITEAQNPGFGTTGGTSAHLNNFFDSSYDEVISKFGLENAKLFLDAGREAIELIKRNVDRFNVDCTYEKKTGYIFSVEEKQNKIFENMLEAAGKVGWEMNVTDSNPFPVPFLKIASLPGQAQFNPILYIDGLLEKFKQNGGTVFTGCMVTEADEGDVIKVTTSLGEISCRNLVYATHIPPGVNLLHFRNAPYRSYVMAVTLKNGNYPQALGYDLSDPYYYYRSQMLNGKEYLLVGGEDHKTGHEENTDHCFRELEAHIRTFFDVDEVAFRWSSQYFVPTDGLPYIGHLPGNGNNVYTATGFNGNGMILGTISGKIIADLIVTGENKYKALFSPARVKPMAGFTNFVKEAADVVHRFVADKFNIDSLGELAELAANEGKIIKYDGHTLALYKDEAQQLHALNPTCTHVHCTVAWNQTERSWDCPCHGARYSIDGEVLTGPARKALEKIDLSAKE